MVGGEGDVGGRFFRFFLHQVLIRADAVAFAQVDTCQADRVDKLVDKPFVALPLYLGLSWVPHLLAIHCAQSALRLGLHHGRQLLLMRQLFLLTQI